MSRTTSKDKQAAGITWTGAWSGLAGGTEVQLENASNLGYAAGTFGDNFGAGKALANGSGAGKANLKSGVDFTYNSKLNATGGSDVDIYDDNASGAFTASHYMRIVNNAKNITDVTGLNIQNIYAKSLAGLSNIWASPLGTDAYIDPEQGKFILPRPTFWSKCETVNPHINYEIAPSSITSTLIGQDTRVNVAGKFGNCLGMGAPAAWDTWCAYGVHVNPTISTKGTASFWTYNAGNFSGCGGVFGGEVLSVGWGYDVRPWGITSANGAVQLMFSSTQIASGATPTGWFHVYVVWDYASGLSGGASLKVYINGVLTINYIGVLPVDGSRKQTYTFWGWTFSILGSPTYCVSYMDNPKYWDHVVSEDPSFEYNAGSGREDALHYIYGAGNGYKPQITGTNNGVGYYYLATSGSPATSGGSGGDETETLKSSLTTNAAGSFGGGGVLCDNSFAALSETSHYNYDKRLDASVGEDPTDGFGATAGGVIDTGAAGALGVGKYVRLVANALNVRDTNYPTAAYGGLKIYAKTLAGINKGTWASPPKDRMYVDPVTGNWSMPRPNHLCKCESGGYGTPEIGTVTTSYVVPAYNNVTNAAGKFGNSLYYYLSGAVPDNTWTTMKNVVDTSFPSKGTVSFWASAVGAASAFYYGAIFFCGDQWAYTGTSGGNYLPAPFAYFPFAVGISTYYTGSPFFANPSFQVWLSGSLISGYVPLAHGVWYHIYAVWDSAKGLAGGKSIRVWVDGANEISSTADLPAVGANLPSFTLASSGNTMYNCWAYDYLDNPKYWNHVVTEDPSFEYNAGAGREDAMHYIYGAANSYKPNLAAASSGVGYYRGGCSTRQCIITV
jgi:hypothetical protein